MLLLTISQGLPNMLTPRLHGLCRDPSLDSMPGWFADPASSLAARRPYRHEVPPDVAELVELKR